MNARSNSIMWNDFLDSRIGLLMTTNIGGAVANNLVANVDSILHLLVSAGQVAVAVVTVLYIAKKIKNLPSKKKPDDEVQD